MWGVSLREAVMEVKKVKCSSIPSRQSVNSHSRRSRGHSADDELQIELRPILGARRGDKTGRWAGCGAEFLLSKKSFQVQKSFQEPTGQTVPAVLRQSQDSGLMPAPQQGLL